MFRRLLAIITVFLFLVGSSIAYDKAPGQFKEFSNPDIAALLEQSIVPIIVTGSAIGTVPTFTSGTHNIEWKFTEGTFAQAGTGYVIGNYIITAAHVVVPEHMMIQTGDHSFWGTWVVQVKSIRITIGRLFEGGVTASIFYINQGDDLAILKFDVPWLVAQPLGYKLANSWGYEQISPDKTSKVSYLNTGDAVAVIVKKRLPDGSQDWIYEVRYGKVITNYPSCPIIEGFITGISDNDFVMDIPVLPGDSGAPVFAFKDGVPIVVGIVRGFVTNSTNEFVSYATKVDFVKRIVEISN
jgi:hypothetical protein